MKRLKLVIGTVFTLSILFCSAVLWNADINRDSSKTEISSAANVKYGEEPEWIQAHPAMTEHRKRI